VFQATTGPGGEPIAPTPAQLAVAPTSLPDNDGNGFLGQAGQRLLEPERIARAERRRAMLSGA